METFKRSIHGINEASNSPRDVPGEELKRKGAPAFFLWYGANVVGHSLQGVDEHVEVGAVNFTLHEELQVCRAVLRLPPRSTFNVEKFRFKRLWKEKDVQKIYRQEGFHIHGNVLERFINSSNH